MDHQFFEDPLASSLSSLEAEIFAGQLPSPPWPDLELDNDVPELDTPTPNAASSGSGSGSGTHKKLSHNAYERDRRKQLNGLYSSLRALLPEADQTKRLSIPLTVSRVLKYIPELQKQVENLEKKKKELMEVSSRQREGQYMSESTRSPVVSATLLSGQEVMVHISLCSKEASTTLPLSRCIRILESEGLHLINSSTFSTSGNRTFYNLHLQRKQGTISMDGQAAFCENLVNVIKKRAAAGSIGQ